MTLTNPTIADDAIQAYLDAEFDSFGEPGERDVEDSRIMVVDDDERIATLMSRVLERDGFRHVTTAGDGQRAVDIVLDRPPDVVVLDVHLPRLDGFEVLREILRHDAQIGRVTGVVAVSGDASPDTCQTMLWAGADDFIPRPFANAEFALRVRRIAERTRALRRAMGYAQLLDGHLPDAPS